jgi:uncharacterized damage-inducible protein DinB
MRRMSETRTAAWRAPVADFLDWREAHPDFDAAVAGVPPALRGTAPPGCPHSLWQLVEHLRIAQHDILDFCRNPDYREMKWPDDYWPTAEPPTASAWDESIAAYRRDCDAMRQLARDPAIDLLAKIPHGTGQTCLREVLLVADHGAYHIGQIVLVRRLLGIWPSA